MQTLFKETNGIHDDHEYHDISERLRQVDRAIIQLIVVKEEYEKMIEEYLQERNQKPV